MLEGDMDRLINTPFLTKKRGFFITDQEGMEDLCERLLSNKMKFYKEGWKP